jgi:hypothetical protein
MLPFAALCSIVIAVLAWRQAQLANYEGYAVAKAIVETLGAAAITIAVTGALVSALLLSTAFTLAGPVIFAVTFGLKALFHAGAAIYFGIKQFMEKNAEKKTELRGKCKDAAISSIVGILGTTAIIGVMLLAKPALVYLGIVAGAIGTAFGIVKCIELVKKRQALLAAATMRETEGSQPDHTISSDKYLQQSFASLHHECKPDARQREDEKLLDLSADDTSNTALISTTSDTNERQTNTDDVVLEISGLQP